MSAFTRALFSLRTFLIHDIVFHLTHTIFSIANLLSDGRLVFLLRSGSSRGGCGAADARRLLHTHDAWVRESWVVAEVLMPAVLMPLLTPAAIALACPPCARHRRRFLS